MAMKFTSTGVLSGTAVALLSGGVILLGATAPEAKACDSYSDFDPPGYDDNGCSAFDNGYYGNSQEDFNDYPDNSQFMPCGCIGSYQYFDGFDSYPPFFGQIPLLDADYAGQ